MPEFDRAFLAACELGEIDAKLKDATLTARARAQLLRERRRLHSYFTPPRVARAYRWKRKIIDIAMRLYPSMHLPPVKEFLQLDDVKPAVLDKDAPPHWRYFPARAEVPVRRALRQANFCLLAGPRGRPRAKR